MDKQKAKEAIELIRHCIMNDKCELIDCGYYCTLPYLEELIKYIDSSDSVINCKDCKFYFKQEYRCVLWGMEMKSDFYCGSGEEPNDEDRSLEFPLR